ASGGNRTVSKFAPDGTPIATLAGLNGPRALAVDTLSNLYVTNFSGNSVSVFELGSTTPTATLVGVNAPDALGFDASGNLYVTNFFDNTISVFAPGRTTPTYLLAGSGSRDPSPAPPTHGATSPWPPPLATRWPCSCRAAPPLPPPSPGWMGPSPWPSTPAATSLWPTDFTTR